MSFMVHKLGCPNCGATHDGKSHRCGFCGSVILLTSVATAFRSKLDAKKVSESVTKWRKAIKDDPSNGEAHYALGIAYLNSKLLDPALMHLRHAVLLAPEMGDAHFNLAMALFNDGAGMSQPLDYPEMVKEIDYAIKVDPDFKEALAFKHFFMAEKLAGVDDVMVRASAEYLKAIEICPDIAVFHHRLGVYAGSYPEAATAELKRAIELDPYYSPAYESLCYAYMKYGNIYERRQFDIDLFGENFGPADIKEQKESYVTGIEYGLKALQLGGLTEAQNYSVHLNLSKCLLEMDHFDEAREHAGKALALCNDDLMYNPDAEKMKEKAKKALYAINDRKEAESLEREESKDKAQVETDETEANLRDTAELREAIEEVRNRGPQQLLGPSRKTWWRLLLAILLPFGFFFSVNRFGALIIALLMQIFYLWIPASIWALYAYKKLDNEDSESARVLMGRPRADAIIPADQTQ